MSGLINAFVEILRETPVEDQPVSRPPENTFLKFCSVCFELMPHYRRDDHCECSVCGLKTYRGEQGSIVLEFLFWLALILFVLLVILKDVPW